MRSKVWSWHLAPDHPLECPIKKKIINHFLLHGQTGFFAATKSYTKYVSVHPLPLFTLPHFSLKFVQMKRASMLSWLENHFSISNKILFLSKLKTIVLPLDKEKANQLEWHQEFCPCQQTTSSLLMDSLFNQGELQC